MDKLLDNPWFLRFTALFLAILLFYTVQVGDDKSKKTSSTDEMEVIRNVPVEVYYDNENLIVTGVPETVNVTIEGPVNIVQTTKLLKDFTLYVDLSSLPMGTHQVEIQHENISDKLQVRIDPSTIDVNIEEKITETFRVEPEFNERLLAEGYYIDAMEVNPSRMEITGAKSVIESISFVKATVSTDSGIKESFEQDAKVRVLDRDLNKLDVEMASNTVRINVDIKEHAKEVPISINQKGTPASGVEISSLTPEVDKITLAGPIRALNTIESFPIDVDVSKITESGTIEVKLEKPKDTIRLSAKTLKVKVVVTVESVNEVDENSEADEMETVQIDGIPVTVTGLNPKFKSTITDPENEFVMLTVKADENIVGSLKASDFTATVDASSIDDEGEGTYPLLVTGPPQTEWTLSKDKITMTIELA